MEDFLEHVKATYMQPQTLAVIQIASIQRATSNSSCVIYKFHMNTTYCSLFLQTFCNYLKEARKKKKKKKIINTLRVEIKPLTVQPDSAPPISPLPNPCVCLLSILSNTLQNNSFVWQHDCCLVVFFTCNLTTESILSRRDGTNMD